VTYSVAPYTGVEMRTGVLTVGGQDFTITQSGTGPLINSVSMQGKNLVIAGENFDCGTVILLEGEQRKTICDPADSSALIGKKLVKQIAPGQSVRIQVKNSKDVASPVFHFTRSL
jgi:hypothetical protein